MSQRFDTKVQDLQLEQTTTHDDDDDNDDESTVIIIRGKTAENLVRWGQPDSMKTAD